MPCLEPNQLFDFANGLGTPEVRAEAERHLDTCASCRTVVAEAMRTSASGQAFESTVTPGHAAAPQALVPGTHVERFVILERAGAGAMGVVYAAYDPVLDRRCALKLLLEGAAGPDLTEQRARLLREARALARLSHPNVVAVHEVLEWNGQIAVAMEYVDGVTLTQWLREGGRTVEQIVGVMADAGRGLAAAHAAGVIHRDFKPDNVLIGRDGRARVSDFGLARPEERPALSTLPEAQAASVDVLSRPFVGTPAYMAPEQIEQGHADARSDQFAFCVALYEALYETRPFPGGSLAQMLQSQKEGRLALPEGGVKPPRHVLTVLGRGLAPNPDDRYPSMEGVVQALSARRPGRTREVWLGAGAIAVVGMLGSVAWVRHQRQSQLCTGGATEVAAAWGPTQRAAVTHALESSGLPFAADAVRETTKVLDAYAQTWAAMHREACEATRIRGTQSDEALGLRMACLGQRLHELDGVTRALSSADKKLAQRSVRAAEALSPIASCGDLEALRARVKPPTNPATRAQVDELRTHIIDAKVLLDTGRFSEGLTLITEVATRAQAVGYAPLTAEALWLEGSLREQTGDVKGGAEAMNQAVLAAEAGGDAFTAASAWSDLVYILGNDLRKTDDALAANAHAKALIQQLGGDDQLESRRLYGLGVTHLAMGQVKQALEDHEKALALREHLSPPDLHFIELSMSAVAATHMRMGDARAALETERRALALLEPAYGKDHPDIDVILSIMANCHTMLGEYEDALAANQRAMAIVEKTQGPTGSGMCIELANVGQSLNLLKRNTESEEVLRRALDICAKSFGENDPRVALVLNHLGGVLYDEKRFPEALGIYQRSLAAREKSLGLQHPDLMFALDEIGNTLIAQHKQRQAVPYLQRALDLAEKSESNPRNVASVRLNLGVALWEGNVDKKRARVLVAEARDTFAATAKDGRPKELENAEKWLREHPASRAR